MESYSETKKRKTKILYRRFTKCRMYQRYDFLIYLLYRLQKILHQTSWWFGKYPRRTREFHCLECIHSWKPQLQNESCAKYIKCNACGGKLKIQGCNQVHFREIEYSAVLEICESYQVVRIICSHKHMKKNFPPLTLTKKSCNIG